MIAEQPFRAERRLWPRVADVAMPTAPKSNERRPSWIGEQVTLPSTAANDESLLRTPTCRNSHEHMDIGTSCPTPPAFHGTSSRCLDDLSVFPISGHPPSSMVAQIPQSKRCRDESLSLFYGHSHNARTIVRPSQVAVDGHKAPVRLRSPVALPLQLPHAPSECLSRTDVPGTHAPRREFPATSPSRTARCPPRRS